MAYSGNWEQKGKQKIQPIGRGCARTWLSITRFTHAPFPLMDNNENIGQAAYACT